MFFSRFDSLYCAKLSFLPVATFSYFSAALNAFPQRQGKMVRCASREDRRDGAEAERLLARKKEDGEKSDDDKKDVGMRIDATGVTVVVGASTMSLSMSRSYPSSPRGGDRAAERRGRLNVVLIQAILGAGVGRASSSKSNSDFTSFLMRASSSMASPALLRSSPALLVALVAFLRISASSYAFPPLTSSRCFKSSILTRSSSYCRCS